jgi:ABC-type Fe3+ transport system permease subunit
MLGKTQQRLMSGIGEKREILELVRTKIRSLWMFYFSSLVFFFLVLQIFFIMLRSLANRDATISQSGLSSKGFRLVLFFSCFVHIPRADIKIAVGVPSVLLTCSRWIFCCKVMRTRCM